MIKYQEIVSYEHLGIKVAVKIDYKRRLISLVEPKFGEGEDYPNKRWVFADRALGYTKGWKNILKAMDFAICVAEKALSDYITAEEKEGIDLVEKMLLADLKKKK